MSYRAGPWKPLTPQQDAVAWLVAIGLGAKEIAGRLHMETSTVRSHIKTIADLIPNPDGIGAYRLVMLWAAHRLWLAEYHTPPDTHKKVG